MYVNMYTYVCIYMYIHIHTYTYIYIHLCMRSLLGWLETGLAQNY